MSNQASQLSRLLITKPLDLLLKESQESGEHSLKRVLGPVNLITLGIGAIIGAGIFVLTGAAAAKYAGPAIVLSFVLAGVACVFAGLCYAEFASLIPIAGSAYTYGYATLGELFAWIIGWDLILEYAFGAATVASGWSGYFLSLMNDIGVHIPPALTSAPGTKLILHNGNWEHLARVKDTLTSLGIDPGTLPQMTASFNFVAFLAILAVTTILVIGIKESANFNSMIVIVKVAIVLIFIAIAGAYVIENPAKTISMNWKQFIPTNTGDFGSYGWSGIARAASVIFFAYIGFDAVSTAAQEAKNPQKDMPIGIMGSLAICTVLYILVSGILTMVVPYTSLNVSDPVAVGIDATGVKWGIYLVKTGAIFGLGTVMLVMLLGQSRVFYSMAHDGLLPKWAGTVHPRFRTPYISSITVGLFVAFFAALLPIDILGELVSIGTLLAFIIVSAGVWILRRRRPELNRPFKAPWVPFTPIFGILISGLLMASLPLDTWLRLIVWLVIGLTIYFSYGRYHSLLGQQSRLPSKLVVVGALMIIVSCLVGIWGYYYTEGRAVEQAATVVAVPDTTLEIAHWSMIAGIPVFLIGVALLSAGLLRKK
jgi:APA family basic amino acid/polyamine antiporter